ncbi:MAG: polyprenyl diphosphate synthase [Pseudolabrys sp.]
MLPQQTPSPVNVDFAGRPAISGWRAIRQFVAAAFGVATRPLYRAYERQLMAEVVARAAPRHVGIILDGNRRYGQQWGFTDPAQVYALGARKLDDVLDWCGELAIPAVTLWVCSTDNLSRPEDQVSGILAAVEAKLLSLVDNPRIHSQRVRVQTIGRLGLLPERTVAAIRAAREATAGYDGMVLTIAIAYGGREEIVDSVRTLLSEEAAAGLSLQDAIARITPESIGSHMYLAGVSDPDLIIRTSGEIRMSGFLLWQSANSEYYFSDVFWPAFRKIDFLRAVRAFQQRQRRFGL